MATFKAYPNGATMGRGNTQPVGGPRGLVTGWSASSVRRHKRWLYSVETTGLDGIGAAVTLTLRECPADHEEWRGILNRLFDRLRLEGFTRWHWVVEWQRRGVPHVHMAVYGRPPEFNSSADVGNVVVAHWLALTAASYRAALAAQHVTPITGAVGWLQYLSKHASRGVAHYQRQGMPEGWTKTGRLWGYGGNWPVGEPIAGVLTDQQMHRVRRMVRRYAIAQARSAALKYDRAGQRGKASAAWDSVAFLRGMLTCNDRALSTVRGVSDWVPGPVFIQMAVCAGWEGELSEPSETV